MQAEWVLTWPHGYTLFVCGAHMERRSKTGSEPYPRCDEYRTHPANKPPECYDCQAQYANGKTPTGPT